MISLERRKVLTGSALGVGALLMPAEPSYASGHRVPARFFGLHDGTNLSYKHLSVGSVRLWDVGTTWMDLETAPDVFDWTVLDSLIGAAHRHGARPLLVLGQTPLFYASATYLPPANDGPFKNYVTRVMRRYGNGIDYQVWNEGNVELFWQGGMQRLAKFTQIVHHLRNQFAPRSKVIAPSMATTRKYQRKDFSKFHRQKVNGTPVWHFYDSVGVSLYPLENQGPEEAFNTLRFLRKRLNNVGVPDRKRFWVNEINYGLTFSDANQISDSRQAANVLRTFLLGAVKHVERVFWYRYDMGGLPDGGTIANTLLTPITNHDVLTPAGHQFNHVQHLLSGTIVNYSVDSDGTHAIKIRKNGRYKIIYWNPLRNVIRHHTKITYYPTVVWV